MPPVAVKIVDVPEQIVALLTASVGVAFTVTVDVFVLEHPLVVPVIVYIMVVVGLAVTVEPVVALRLVPGVHE